MEDAGRRLTGLRLMLAGLLLLGVCVLPVMVDDTLTVLELTREQVPLVFAFALCTLPEAWVEVRAFALASRWRSLRVLFVLVMVACAVTWIFNGIGLFVPRFQFLIAYAGFFLGAIGWFRRFGDQGLRWVVLAKVVAVSYASVRMGLSIANRVPSAEIFLHPPSYRHLRHFNYDIFSVAPVAAVALRSTRIGCGVLVFGFYVALGYFSMWSSGRGSMVALVFACAILLWSRRSGESLLAGVSYAVAFCLGAFLVWVTGSTDFVSQYVTISSSASANAVTNGRLDIWMGTLRVVFKSDLPSVLFGHGPDAFVYNGVYSQFHHFITHPHNALVQWLYEMGIVGTAALMMLMAALVLRTAWPALKSGGWIPRSVAATAVGFMAFAMFDGIYYHVAPMLFNALLWSYLIARFLPLPDQDHSSA